MEISWLLPTVHVVKTTIVIFYKKGDKMKTLIKFIKDEDAASMAEYALLLGLITVAIAGVITIFGGRIRAVFTRAANVIR